MKRILFALAVLCAATAANAQEPRLYECVRPDGTVVCTVADTSGNPSVTCNHDCVDCNLVCAARARLTEGGTMQVVPPPVAGQRTPPEPGGVAETRQYCQQTRKDCVARCKSDPLNRSAYDMDACISDCNDWFSGCGKMNRRRAH